jgi:hypothetical protein
MPNNVEAMSVTPLRPTAPARFRRASAPRSSDVLLAEISALVAERQRLRTGDANADRLEKNRLRIARAQWELSYALILSHSSDVAYDAADAAAAA